MATHLVIPDTQVKPDVPTDHLRWIGQFIVDKRPDKVIHLGDHWDMPSLSSYDKGKKAMEGRRYKADVRAGNEGMALLNEPLNTYNAKRARFKERQWWPERYLLRGNHEFRIERAVESDAQLEEVIGYHDLLSPGWEVVPFLEVLELDGVAYSHYFYNPMNGRALSGQAITRLKTVGRSFTMGHQQTYDIAVRFVGGRAQRALIAGCCYLHDEDYLGPQGNHQWRGVILKHEVENGDYSITEVTLDYLCRRYEGMSLEEFLARS
jgi:hypothetical protein